MLRQSIVLVAAAIVLVVSAWLFAAERGVAAMAAGIGFGWMARLLSERAPPPTAAVPSRPAAPPQAAPAEVVARLQVLEAKTSSLRHDLRGILSPALLTAERLLGNEDPAIRRAGEIMVKTVERASARLAETKG